MNIPREPFSHLATAIHLQTVLLSALWLQSPGEIWPVWRGLAPPRSCVTSALAAVGRNAAALKSFALLLSVTSIEQHCDPVKLFQFFSIFTGSLKHFQKNRSILHKPTELCWLPRTLCDMTWIMPYAFVSSTPAISQLFLWWNGYVPEALSKEASLV